MLRLSRGEKQGSDRARHQILANTFEAVIGAMYLDQGYEATKNFITSHILSTLDEILESGSWRDPKSRLQEVAQSIDNMTPQYKVMSEDGPDHDKTFTLGVYIGNRLLGQGTGPSKQIAQQAAAQNALATYEKKKR
jgi:ribonuclease-3